MSQYELTVDGHAEEVDESGLADWLCENFSPDDRESEHVLSLQPGQSFYQDNEGLNEATWKVWRLS